MEYFIDKVLSGIRAVWSELTIHESYAVIVNNLPDAWTSEELQRFLEKDMDLLTLVEDGIQFRHTNFALLSLAKPMTDQSMMYANEKLGTVTFCGRHLQLESRPRASKSTKKEKIPLRVKDKAQPNQLKMEPQVSCMDRKTPRKSYTRLTADGDTTGKQERFTNRNRPHMEQFIVQGHLKGKAFGQWFSADLDKIKQMILKNDGEIEQAETTSHGYILVFTCSQEILHDVFKQLIAIECRLEERTVNLNDLFPDYADRALIVNGLLNMTTDIFCAHLGQKLQLKQLQSMLDFMLPQKCHLPTFGLTKLQKHPQRRCFHQDSHAPTPHSSRDPALPYTIREGGTNITVKVGDITQEEVDVAVCPVTNDLKLCKTHLGKDFHRICPQLQKKLNLRRTEGNPSVIDIHVEEDELDTYLCAPVIYHAVLFQRIKTDTEKVSDLITKRTMQILRLASQRGKKSVVFPPMGVGRRFQYDKEVVASAMTSAFSEFLQKNPRTLTDIIIAVNDLSVARHFAQVVKERNSGTVAQSLIPKYDRPGINVLAPIFPGLAAFLFGFDEEDANGATGSLETDETLTYPFEVLIVTHKGQNIERVIDILLNELETTFLFHETMDDVETFEEQLSGVQQEILSEASDRDVLLSMSKEGLSLYGQKHKVHQVRFLIREKMYDAILQPVKQGWKKRRQLGLPVDTDHLLPTGRCASRTKSLTYERAMEKWRRKNVHTTSVSPEEEEAITYLVMDTWEEDKAVLGKDARSLIHRRIEVVKVERLENPELWRLYSQKREQLFNALVDHHTGHGPAKCTPVECLPMSSGPVQTSKCIPIESPLHREIYQQVNEHYLFHGTKKERLRKIFSQGLDFRLAESTMLGRGVYAAESSTKANQYTDEKQSRTSGVELKMILLRMLLGEPFLHTEKGGTPFARPPCMTCKQRNCDCPNSRLFNSVVDDKRLFREFVVYDQNVCYPEYIITYRRV